MNKIWAILFLLVGVVAKAQYPVYRQLTKLDGLPSNTVYSTVQDKDGYLWLGTEKGLVKFDGYSYQLFIHPEMTGQSVSDLQVDKTGRVWCQNFVGQHFYIFNDSLHCPSHINIAGFYTPVWFDEQSSIYMATQTAIKIYDSSLVYIDSIPLSQYIYIPLTLNKHLAFTDPSFLYQYKNGKLNLLNDFVVKNPSESRIYNFVVRNRVFCYGKATNTSAVYQVYPSHQEVNLNVKLSGSVLQNVSVTNDSLVWLNTTDGVYVYNHKLQLINTNQPLLKGYSISSVYQDANKAYWITTIGDGVFYIPNLNTLQYHVNNESFSRICLYKNQQFLLGGKSGVLYQISPNSRTLKPFVALEKKQQVSALVYDSVQDYTLVASAGVEVFKQQKKVASYSAAIKELKCMQSGAFLFAATGFIGAISTGNASFLSAWKSKLNLIKTENNVTFYRFYSNADGLRCKTITATQNKQKIYVGTSKGLLKLTPTNEVFITFNGKPVIATSLEWVNGELFVSTENQGILRLLNDSLITINGLTEKLGQSVNKLSLAGGSLYILSENGAYVYHPKLKKLTSVFVGPGQSGGDEYKDIDANHEFVFLSVANALKVIPLKHDVDYVEKSKLSIKLVNCNYTSLNADDALQLSSHQNNIQILFTIPWLNLNDKLVFYYQINDGAWLLVPGGERTLNLFSLAPGNYIIRLKAESVSGFKSSVTSYHFVILPPLIERWWFQLLLVLVLSLSFYLFYVYRLMQVNKRGKLLADNMALEADLQKSMLSSIKAQMNPHFIFNSLNTIQSYIYLNDRQNASRFLSKFSSLTRKILEMSNEDTITLESEIAALKLYLELEKMRFEETFEFSITMAQDLSLEHMRLPSMILQPYVENAIKHGLLHKDSDRKLEINFDRNDNFLVVTIDDNGVGRKRSAEINSERAEQHLSFSTQANKKRLELLMQSKSHGVAVKYIDKHDANERPTGTRVVITIPITETGFVN